MASVSFVYFAAYCYQDKTAICHNILDALSENHSKKQAKMFPSPWQSDINLFLF